MDYNNAEVDNSGAFDLVLKELKKGCCVGLFPEGLGRYQSYLSPFKTGLARLCVDFVCEQYEKKQKGDINNNNEFDYINIVPYGLNYLHRDMFRSPICVLIGDPIRIDKQTLKLYGLDLDSDLIHTLQHSSNSKAWEDLKFQASKAITLQLRQSFDLTTVHAPNWNLICLAHLARDLAFPLLSVPSSSNLSLFFHHTRFFSLLFSRSTSSSLPFFFFFTMP
ncbi:acyltransferase domain protein [Reticulomyxa filosa]|uniref:Acyltransferase domain protein n=1 Tax=Reticulomyxa filosa TaxID=46433 RepID=X6MNU7_RETFI|nr:acyltransferase domain protein [Reticulomyxa filosa]|eukprot:ETO14755.1 acyltransferase domain protein [Reticulomyxa filosa]